MEGGAKTHYAVCILKPDGDSTVKGLVKMTQVEGQKVKIVADFENLLPGLHGFHIHEFGNLTNGCKSAGAHYNPHGKNHGGPDDEERHVGDMGNVDAKADSAHFELEDHLIMLHGEFSVIGRSCVVHADEDDLGKGGHELSLTTGNAGARLACGTIGLSMPF